MTKILTARKFKSEDSFDKYSPANIEEKFMVYHEDWQKFEEVKESLKSEGYTVKSYIVVEEE